MVSIYAYYLVFQVFVSLGLLLNWFPPSFHYFPSTGLEVTNFIFGLLVATLEITCTVNFSKSEINLYPVYIVFLFLKIQRYLRTLLFHFTPDGESTVRKYFNSFFKKCPRQCHYYCFYTVSFCWDLSTHSHLNLLFVITFLLPKLNLLEFFLMMNPWFNLPQLHSLSSLPLRTFIKGTLAFLTSLYDSYLSYFLILSLNNCFIF